MCFDSFFFNGHYNDKKMKTEGRSTDVFIVFECLQSPCETRQASA